MHTMVEQMLLITKVAMKIARQAAQSCRSPTIQYEMKPKKHGGKTLKGTMSNRATAKK